MRGRVHQSSSWMSFLKKKIHILRSIAFAKNIFFPFELCLKDMFRRKKGEQQISYFFWFLWRSHKSLWEWEAHMGEPGTGWGREGPSPVEQPLYRVRPQMGLGGCGHSPLGSAGGGALGSALLLCGHCVNGHWCRAHRVHASPGPAGVGTGMQKASHVMLGTDTEGSLWGTFRKINVSRAQWGFPNCKARNSRRSHLPS